MKHTNTRSDIAKEMASSTGKTQVECEQMIEAFAATIKSMLARDERIEIRRLMTMERYHKRYSKYNFKNGNREIASKEIVKIKASTSLLK